MSNVFYATDKQRKDSQINNQKVFYATDKQRGVLYNPNLQVKQNELKTTIPSATYDESYKQSVIPLVDKVNMGNIQTKLEAGEDLTVSERNTISKYGLNTILAGSISSEFDISSQNNPKNVARFNRVKQIVNKKNKGVELSEDEKNTIETFKLLNEHNKNTVKSNSVMTADVNANARKLQMAKASQLYDDTAYISDKIKIGNKEFEADKNNNVQNAYTKWQREKNRLDLYTKTGLSQYAEGVNTTFDVILGKEPDTIAEKSDSAYSIASYALKDYYNARGEKFNSTVQDVVTNIANNAPGIVAGMLAGGVGLPGLAANAVGTSVFGISVFGNSYKEGARLGVTDNEKLLAYSLASTASECALQYAIGGIPGMGGVLSGEMISSLSKSVSSALSKAMIKVIGNSTGEFIEESMQSLLSPILQKYILGANVETVFDNPIDALSSAAYEGFIGLLTSVLTGGFGNVSEAFNEASIQSSGKYYNNAFNKSRTDIKNIAKYFIEVSEKKSELAKSAQNVTNGDTSDFAVGDMMFKAVFEMRQDNKAFLKKVGETVKNSNGGIDAVIKSYETVVEDNGIFPDKVKNLYNTVKSSENISDEDIGEFALSVQIYAPRAKIIGGLLEKTDSSVEVNLDTETGTEYNNNRGERNELSEKGRFYQNVGGMGETGYQDAGGNRENERVWQENQGDFIRRAEGDTGETGQRKRVLLKNGDSTIAYTEKVSDNSQGSTAAKMLKSAGVNAVYCDGDIETNQNGITVKHTEAMTTPDGTVYISSNSTLSAEHMAYHENVHVNDRKNTKEYAEYESVICDNILFDSNQFKVICNQINDNHYGGKYDVENTETANAFIREIAAYINEFVMTDPEFAEQTFAPMFEDWETVVQAAKKFNTDTKADFNGSANFMPGGETDNAVTVRTDGDIADFNGIDTAKAKHLDKAQQDEISQIGKELGRKVIFEDFYSLEKFKGKKRMPDGYIDGNGDVHINYYAKRPVHFLFKHEITHYLKRTLASYNDFMNLVIESNAFKDWLNKKGYSSIDTLKTEIMNTYSEVKGFDESQCYDEILADFVGEYLFGGENAISEKLINALEPPKRKTFKDVIKDIINYFKEKFQKNKPIQTEIQKIENEFIKVYNQAVEQKNTADDGGVKYSLRVEAEVDVERALNDKNYTEDVFLTESSPSIITSQKGTRDLPMLMKASHIRENVFTEQEAKQNGLKVNNNINYHGLGKDLFLKVIDGLDDVNLAYRGTKNASDPSRRENYFLLISQYKDAKGNTINVPVFIDEKGQYNRVFIDTNKIATVFGRDNLSSYIQKEIKNGNLVRIKNKSIQASELTSPINASYSKNAFTDNTVPQKAQSVKNNISKNGEEYSVPNLTNVEELLEKYENGEISRTEYLDALRKEKTLTPAEIANLTEEDANTTPKLNKKAGKNNEDGKSKFYESLMDSDIFDQRFKDEVKDDSFIEKYKTVTNKETLKKAAMELDEGGKSYVHRLMRLEPERANLIDIATGFILIDRYQRIGDYESSIAVAEKVREFGTASGQQVQIFSILGRLNPDTMAVYAQKELSKAFEAMAQSRTQKWIDKNSDRFNLTDEEIEFIRRRTLQAAKLPEGRDKAIKLAEIATLLQDKLPAQKGQRLKTLQRISMLLNAKTNIRNVAGNAVMVPVFITSDFFGSGIDKLTSKVFDTGVRTTGMFDVKSVKGFKKGIFETMDDFRRHINTRNAEMNRFEVGDGKAFNEQHNGKLAKQLNDCAKVLNALDRFTSFCLEMGDRPFYEMWYINSLNNQMKLNNVTEATPEMIAIASTEALQRTWQDSNKVVKAVSNIKQTLNAVNIDGFGLGDVLIKFTKTPANLTKAIFDFSPAGIIKAITTDARNLKTAINKGQFEAKLQKQFVDSFSKGIAGTLLYVMAAALAKKDLLKGNGDDDKDVEKFEKYIQGIPEYSFKIFGKWWSYEWMQPVGAVGAIVTDYMKSKNENPDNKMYEDVIEAIRAGGEVLFNQSFMKSIQTLFTADNIIDGAIDSILGEPSVYIPQLSSQIANATDDYRRTTYEKNKPLQNAINKVKVKLPIARNTLSKDIDVMGREIPNSQKGLFNAFFNPANTFTDTSTSVTDQIYELYTKTKNKELMPRVAPYSVTVKGINKNFTPDEKNDFQRISGSTSADILEIAFKLEKYKKLADEQKIKFIKMVYDFSVAIAKSNIEYDYTTLSAMVGKLANGDEILSETDYKKLPQEAREMLAQQYFLTKSEIKYVNDYEGLVDYYLRKLNK